jgi:hypothetical protein
LTSKHVVPNHVCNKTVNIVQQLVELNITEMNDTGVKATQHGVRITKGCEE